MNYIDLVFGIILIIAAIQGFRKGFIVELASLAALVLGIWGAIKFSDWTAGFISRTTSFHSDHLSTIAFVITFIILSPFVGPFSDAWPKGHILMFSNIIKLIGTLAMLLGLYPLLAKHPTPSIVASEIAPYSMPYQICMRLWNS